MGIAAAGSLQAMETWTPYSPTAGAKLPQPLELMLTVFAAPDLRSFEDAKREQTRAALAQSTGRHLVDFLKWPTFLPWSSLRRVFLGNLSLVDTQALVKVCLCGLMDSGGAWIDDDGLRQQWEGAALLQSTGVASPSTTPPTLLHTAAGYCSNRTRVRQWPDKHANARVQGLGSVPK